MTAATVTQTADQVTGRQPTDPDTRHDMILLIDAADANPNGDPDDDGRPRQDPDTGHGLISGPAIRRKVRDRYAALVEGCDIPGSELFIRRSVMLNDNIRDTAGELRGADASAAIASRFWDVRLFGGVLSTGGDAGPRAQSLRGPVQIGWARSVDPVDILDHTITRVARTDRVDARKDDYGQMGRVAFIRYGLYRAHIAYNPQPANGRDNSTRVTANDLDLFYRAITSMFVGDEAASRQGLVIRGLHVYTHSSPLGNAPAHTIHDHVNVRLLPGHQPSSYTDYEIRGGPAPNHSIGYQDLTDYAWRDAA